MHPSRRHLLPLTLGAPAVLRLRPAAAARPPVGEVSAVSGAALASHPGEPSRPLRPAAPVLMDDTLSTGAGARLACLLEGGIALRLGENATLRIDALTLHGPGARVELRSFAGALLFERAPAGAAPVPASAAPPPTTLHLPWARIGVRGTRFFAGVLDGTGAVFVARGRVTVDAVGTRVVLADGDGVDIPLLPRGPPDVVVRRWGPPRIARAMALVE
jgi:ferric-dicitrate binding protein FerR (iron transport regulator)